jgi:hypothetical protein
MRELGVMVTQAAGHKEDVMAARKTAKKTTKAKKATRKVKATSPRGMAKSNKVYGSGPGF